MLVDSYIVPECIIKPASFGGLMALYESNYIKLQVLTADLGSYSGTLVSTTDADCDLYLSIEKKSKYTCEIRLTYRFDEDEGPVPDPDLVARVYFDARMVEVKSWVNAPRHEVLQRLNRYYQPDLHISWVRNIVLGKWLDYLHERGHSFPANTARTL